MGKGKPFEKNDLRINRRGRPKKGAAISDLLGEELDTVFKSGKLKRQAVAAKLVELALGGDIAALRYLIDRVDGRPLQNTVVEVQDMSEEAKRKMLSIFQEETRTKVRPRIVMAKKKAKPKD